MRKITFVFLALFMPALIFLSEEAMAEVLNGGNEDVYAALPVPLMPWLSADGNTLFDGGSLIAVVDDPNPTKPLMQIPAATGILEGRETATSAFVITYVPDGDTDAWGELCYAFPEEAKAAFEYAASIWASYLHSNVPISICACWADLGSSSILGYTGGQPLHRDFAGARRASTWYNASLANALNGLDLDPSNFDMHTTYNRNFTWYFGTDGNPPLSQHDFVTIALHEICHGLNFSGSMSYSAGYGNWGYSTGLPSIYDVFVVDASGNQLVDQGVYPNSSMTLGSALTSDNVWFNGVKASAANGNVPVKIYAPSTWLSGSSYSHLDYDTFDGTINQLMVYAISKGESIHNPGPVTKGVLEDMGWTTGASSTSYYVDPLGDCDGNTPCFASIQSAVDAANDGYTIKITYGTYYENVTLGTNKQICLSGGWNSSFTEQSSSSSIDSLTRTKGTFIVKRLTIQR